MWSIARDSLGLEKKNDVVVEALVIVSDSLMKVAPGAVMYDPIRLASTVKEKREVDASCGIEKGGKGQNKLAFCITGTFQIS